MENAIKIQLPISVSYTALEGVLRKQMLGGYIPKQEEGTVDSPYAQILAMELAGSRDPRYDIVLRLRISILRTVLKRDKVDLLVYAILDYDNAAQQLVVRAFKLDARTSSGFYNTSLEVLANKVAYNQIIRKARVNIGEIVSKQVEKANKLLESGTELKGIKLAGKVEQVRVQDVAAQEDRLSLLLEVEGNLTADIADLLSLMPQE